ncbi:MAG: dihydrodipicolinate synthase family protein [Lachnospiraceae bacterium]|nr:dihydrodipicolinate synthase family protein [Lachnospiraceae bacterium]
MYESEKNKLTGVQGIFPTPFLENGDVDYVGLAENVRKDIKNGYRFLTCTGTGGEFYALTTEEHKNVIKTVCEAASEFKDVAVVPCIGTTSLRTAVELAQAAEEAGADAVMVTPSFYLPQSLENLKAYFAELAKNTSLPFDFYYYPEVHHTYLSPVELADLLLDNDHFIAMKETALATVASVQIAELVADRINIITGASEYMAPETALIGGKGFVWTWMHIMPKMPLKIWEATEKGDYGLAAAMRKKVMRFDVMLAASGLSCTSTYKLLDEIFGFAGGPARNAAVPKVRNREELKKLVECIREIREDPIFR